MPSLQSQLTAGCEFLWISFIRAFDTKLFERWAIGDESSDSGGARSYSNKPEENAQTVNNGWVRTGDYFVTEEEGYRFFIGRGDDVIKIGAFKVSPAEIEQHLLDIRPHECAEVYTRTGATTFVTTYVWVRNEADLSETVRRQLKRHLEANVSNYKVSRKIGFVSELSKTIATEVLAAPSGVRLHRRAKR